MRAQKLTVLALALAAGLSMTACQNDDDTSGASDSSSSSQAPEGSGSGASSGDDSGAQSSTGGSGDSGGSGGSGDSGNSGNSGGSGDSGGSGGATAAADACKTSQLGFTSSGGMGEGTLIINLKNNGSAACTLHGFPGADLKGKDGTVSADRSKLQAPEVSVQPGDETRFTLHYPPNNSGGSGVTFTSLIVTPPNETSSHTLPVTINVPVDDPDHDTASAITVDPVGTGK